MIFKNAGSGEEVVLAARTFRVDVKEWKRAE